MEDLVQGGFERVNEPLFKAILQAVGRIVVSSPATSPSRLRAGDVFSLAVSSTESFSDGTPKTNFGLYSEDWTDAMRRLYEEHGAPAYSEFALTTDCDPATNQPSRRLYFLERTGEIVKHVQAPVKDANGNIIDWKVVNDFPDIPDVEREELLKELEAIPLVA